MTNKNTILLPQVGTVATITTQDKNTFEAKVVHVSDLKNFDDFEHVANVFVETIKGNEPLAFTVGLSFDDTLEQNVTVFYDHDGTPTFSFEF